MRIFTFRTAFGRAVKGCAPLSSRLKASNFWLCPIVLFALSLASCMSNKNNIQTIDPIGEQWRKTMSLYHVLPVYPPNEDVHVGDLYLFPGCPGMAGIKDADDCEVKLGLDMDGFKVDYDQAVLSDLTTYYSQQFIVKSIAPDQTEPASPSSVGQDQAKDNSCDLKSTVYCILEVVVQERAEKEKKAADEATKASATASAASKAVANAKTQPERSAAQQKANVALSKSKVAKQRAQTAKMQLSDAKGAADMRLDTLRDRTGKSLHQLVHHRTRKSNSRVGPSPWAHDPLETSNLTKSKAI